MESNYFKVMTWRTLFVYTVFSMVHTCSVCSCVKPAMQVTWRVLWLLSRNVELIARLDNGGPPLLMGQTYIPNMYIFNRVLQLILRATNKPLTTIQTVCIFIQLLTSHVLTVYYCYFMSVGPCAYVLHHSRCHGHHRFILRFPDRSWSRYRKCYANKTLPRPWTEKQLAV